MNAPRQCPLVLLVTIYWKEGKVFRIGDRSAMRIGMRREAV
jgi:hypothetical protein